MSLCENHAPRNRLQPNSEPRSNKTYAVPSWCTLSHSQMCISLLHFSSEPQTLKHRHHFLLLLLFWTPASTLKYQHHLFLLLLFWTPIPKASSPSSSSASASASSSLSAILLLWSLGNLVVLAGPNIFTDGEGSREGKTDQGSWCNGR